jgi:hypothetical protein
VRDGTVLIPRTVSLWDEESMDKESTDDDELTDGDD